MSCCFLCIVLLYVFVLVSFNLTCRHGLQHVFFEHLLVIFQKLLFSCCICTNVQMYIFAIKIYIEVDKYVKKMEILMHNCSIYFSITTS